MIKIHFKNLEVSELAKEITKDRMATVVRRFPDLDQHRISIRLSMENAPGQAGPDQFTVKVHISGKRYKNVILEKSGSSLYLALAEVVDHLLERLNRYGDRERVKKRNQLREIQEEVYLS